MRRHYLFERLPSGQALRQNRFLRPFRRYLDRHFLWQFNRKTVAGGVAVGLFCGILSPVAQIFFAAIGALMFRVNLPIAAISTLITNPFTVPPIYYAAYRLGDFLAGSSPPVAADVAQTFLDRLSDATVMEFALGIGLPLLLGLAVFAVAASVLGYVAVQGLWLLSVRRRWSRRRYKL